MFSLPYWTNFLVVLLLLGLWLSGVNSLPVMRQEEAVPTRNNSWRIITTVISLTIASMLMIKAHGAYDAWLQWNTLARYMSSPATFRYLGEPDSIWHADYPPGLASFIGFVWRMLGSDPEWVPRSISFLFYLATVLLLCQEAFQVRAFPGLWLSVLAVFALNFECLSQGLNQYADVPLGFMLLLVFILLEHYEQKGQRSAMYLIGFYLGACMLLKNEGMMLAVCVLLVNARSWFNLQKAGLLFLGMMPALILILIYKAYIPQANDLIENFSPQFWLDLLDADKYLVILRRAIRVIGGRYPLPLLFTIWALWQLRHTRRFWKSRILAALVLCFAGFIFTYLTTDYDIVWLTNTSFNRVLMQLTPAFIYFLISSLRKAFPVGDQAPSQ